MKIEWLSETVLVDTPQKSIHIPVELLEPSILENIKIIKPLIPQIITMLNFLNQNTFKCCVLKVEFDFKDRSPKLNNVFGNLAIGLDIGGFEDFFLIESYAENKYIGLVIFDDIKSGNKEMFNKITKRIIQLREHGC